MMARKGKYIGICSLIVVIIALEIWINPIYTAEGALRHTLLARGYVFSALFSEIEDVSDAPSEYVADVTFRLSENEQLYWIKDHVPYHPATETPLDTWIVRKSGFWYRCEFSGKG